MDLQKLVVDLQGLRGAASAAAAELAKAVSACSPGRCRSAGCAAGDGRGGQGYRSELSQDLAEVGRRDAAERGDRPPGDGSTSESDGDRLAAVLVLEARPDAAYLRWLSERVTVEDASIGLLAVKALIIAALRLGLDDLERVRLAVQGERPARRDGGRRRGASLGDRAAEERGARRQHAHRHSHRAEEGLDGSRGSPERLLCVSWIAWIGRLLRRCARHG